MDVNKIHKLQNCTFWKNLYKCTYSSEKDELEKWHFLQVCKLGKRAMFCKMKTLEMA